MSNHYYVLIEYNYDNADDTEAIGIYSSKENAIKKILKIYNDQMNNIVRNNNSDPLENLFRSLTEDERFVKNLKIDTSDISWEHIEKIVKHRLDHCGAVSSLNSFWYKIDKCELDE
jgi:predicted component of type VI protein secretion system